MKLIVGLGNPGKDYENTRHNVGFMILDSFGYDFKLEKKFQAYIHKEKINNEDVLFVKPLTYMNLSGDAVLKILQYYQISFNDILIIQDDLDLDFGTFRIKVNSSAGGHNGIKSIIERLKTQEFWRIKIGISKARGDVIDYVLQKFSKNEMSFFEEHFSFYQELVRFWISFGGEKTMEKYNSLGRSL